MKEKEAYIAFDEKEFDNVTDCLAHERKVKKEYISQLTVKQIKDLCNTYEFCGECPCLITLECPFQKDSPCDWKI